MYIIISLQNNIILLHVSHIWAYLLLEINIKIVYNFLSC